MNKPPHPKPLSVEALLRQFRKQKLEKHRARKKKGLCNAQIHHGPGHQGNTYCDQKGPHKIHHAIYGRYEQEAFWRGMKVFSGYFDEPPDLR